MEKDKLNKLKNFTQSLGYYLYKVPKMEQDVNMQYAKQILSDIEYFLRKESNDLVASQQKTLKEEYFKRSTKINSPNEKSIARLGNILQIKKDLVKQAVIDIAKKKELIKQSIVNKKNILSQLKEDNEKK